jgi:ammonia channel protein AmtB
MAIAGLITICWLMFGYSLAFGQGRYNRFIGGSEKFWFMGSGPGSALSIFLDFFPSLHARLSARVHVCSCAETKNVEGDHVVTHFCVVAEADNVTVNSLVGTIPETVFITFQLTFAIITAAITASSFAERMKFSSMLIFFIFWHFLVYCPVAHWLWSAGGFMQTWGVLDFAGGNVVCTLHLVQLA